MVTPLFLFFAATHAAPFQASPELPRAGLRQVAEAGAGDSIAAFRAAHAHLKEAGILLHRGSLVDAEQGFLQARWLFRQLRDSGGEAEALHGLARVRQATGGPKAALPVLDEALRLPLASVPATAAALRCERASVRGHAGHPDALEEAEAGYRLAQAVADQEIQLLCLRTMLPRLSKEGITDRLLDVIHRMEALARETGQYHTLVSALTWRGGLLRGAWKLDAARATLLEALRIGDEIGHNAGQAWTLLELARLYAEAADHASAAPSLSRAVQIFERIGERQGLAEAHLLEANGAIRAGRPTLADSLFQQVLLWAEENGVTHQRIGARYGLAATAAHRREWRTATDHLDALERLVREQRIAGTEGSNAFARGMLALRRNDLAAAEPAFRRAAGISRTEGRLHQFEAQGRLAQVLALRGEIDAAEAELRRTSDQLDAWRDSLAGRELRLLAFQRHDIFGDPSAGLPSTLAALVRAGRVEAAFELAERRRARDLFDRLVRTRALQPDAGEEDAAHRPTSLPLPNATHVRSSLPDVRTALVEYVGGGAGEPTVLFVVTRDDIAAHVLPPLDSAAADMRRFLRLIEAGEEARHLGRRLGALLLDPATRSLPSEVMRLIIVPDGALHRLPFDALVLDDDRYVLERYAVTLAPSAMVAAELWRRPPATHEAAILAFGDPRFAGEAMPVRPDAEVYRSGFSSDGGLPRLAASGHEAWRVARYARRAEVRLGEQASAAYVRQAPLKEFRVLHFATHARVDEAALTRSALALAPSAGDDGFLGAADLLALSLDADIVVLSACRTAGGVVLTGEGVQGLSEPLLAAGARSVAATLWPIGDRRTVRLMDDFYRSLADGLPAGDAIRAAKLRALQRGAAPAEWASFTLIGDSHVRVPLRRPGLPWAAWAAWLVTAGAALGMAAYGARRRKVWRWERS